MQVLTAILIIVAISVGFVMSELLPEKEDTGEYKVILEAYVDSLAASQTALKEKEQTTKDVGELKNKIEALSQEIEQTQRTQDRPSPKDRVAQEQIRAGENGIFLDIAGTRVWYALGTKSMDPLLDTGTNVITVVPKDEEDLFVGDIVAFQWEGVEQAVVHRIVAINVDENGTYYTTKGDNNPVVDPVRVRFEDIIAVVVAIVY